MRASNIIQFPGYPRRAVSRSWLAQTGTVSSRPGPARGTVSGLGAVIPPTGEAYADWVEQVFMTDAVFSAEEIDGAMDRAWGDAVERGFIQENAYFAGVDGFQDPSTGMWGVQLTYYVPSELADPSRVPGAKKGMPWWGWLGIGLGAVAVTTTIVLIVKRKKPRRRK